MMTAIHRSTGEETRPIETASESKVAESGEDLSARKSRSPKRLRLPRDVLVRVDVLQDEHGHIQAYTRERLSPGWGGERNEVASLLVRTGLDVLDGFAQERLERVVTDEEEDEDEDDGLWATGHRNSRASTPSLSPDLRQLYR
jgi:hypothetical protein